MTPGWLILDVDDTIVDTVTVGFAKCAGAAEQLGLPPPSATAFADLYGTVPFEQCVRRLHPGVDLSAYQAAYDACSESFPARPIGDVRAALMKARDAGFRLGVLTNGPGHKTTRKLAAAGLRASDFEFVRHAGNTVVAKPDAAAFTRLAAEQKLTPQSCWYVSDRPADWLGAVDAGYRVAGVVTGALPVRTGLLPQVVAPSLEPIVTCLAALPARPAAPPHPARAALAVTLDAGFTLIEHVRPPSAIVAEILRRHGRELPEPLSPPHASIWVSDSAITAGLTEHYLRYATGLSEAAATELAAEAIAGYTAPANWRARQGADILLRRIRAAALPAAVVSNWQSTLPDVLKATGLLDDVDAVLASAAYGFAKPDMRLFRAAAAVLEVALGGVVHLGDDPASDGAGAVSAGCRVVLIDGELTAPATNAAVTAVTGTEGNEQ